MFGKRQRKNLNVVQINDSCSCQGGQKDGVVDSVEGCREIEENQDRGEVFYAILYALVGRPISFVVSGGKYKKVILKKSMVFLNWEISL